MNVRVDPNTEHPVRSKNQSKKLKCAIYTRKSSEEGLEQEFNSLDAQREACEAYIASQASLGWKLVKKPYDDGGISGGTMKRPALQELLQDIRKELVDVIVVYKIDRLTRSLMDFAKMVDVFDGKGVSFVSVTQQFNTTTSMGRLTLNVLLSFAQFEREVTGERIRDKIAASKKKGMWMGGKVPLGYKVEDRKLLINTDEAETVRYLFKEYLELGSVTKLVAYAKAKDLTGRVVHQKNGTIRTTRPFGRGNLYHLLANPIYNGKVTHKDEVYDGQHEAIIEPELWGQVQARLKANAVNRKLGTNTKSRNLLTGLLYDDNSNRLTPSHANKKGLRYCYYVSSQLIEGESKTERTSISAENESRNALTTWRIPATEIDVPVVNIIKRYLEDPIKLQDLVEGQSQTIEHHQRVEKAAKTIAQKLQSGRQQKTREVLQNLLSRVELHADKLVIEIKLEGVHQSLGLAPLDDQSDNPIKCIELPHHMKRRGVEARLVIGNQEHREPDPNHHLIMLIAKAHEYLEKLTNGTASSISELAKQEGGNASRISRHLRLTFLAPDIIESILAGTQPVDLTAEKLRRLIDMPGSWQEQRELLGFAA